MSAFQIVTSLFQVDGTARLSHRAVGHLLIPEHEAPAITPLMVGPNKGSTVQITAGRLSALVSLTLDLSRLGAAAGPPSLWAAPCIQTAAHAFTANFGTRLSAENGRAPGKATRQKLQETGLDQFGGTDHPTVNRYLPLDHMPQPEKVYLYTQMMLRFSLKESGLTETPTDRITTALDLLVGLPLLSMSPRAFLPQRSAAGLMIGSMDHRRIPGLFCYFGLLPFLLRNLALINIVLSSINTALCVAKSKEGAGLEEVIPAKRIRDEVASPLVNGDFAAVDKALSTMLPDIFAFARSLKSETFGAGSWCITQSAVQRLISRISAHREVAASTLFSDTFVGTGDTLEKTVRIVENFPR